MNFAELDSESAKLTHCTSSAVIVKSLLVLQGFSNFSDSSTGTPQGNDFSIAPYYELFWENFSKHNDLTEFFIIVKEFLLGVLQKFLLKFLEILQSNLQGHRQKFFGSSFEICQIFSGMFTEKGLSQDY